MTDTGAHPGVKSLLARFENQQNNSSSPSRDRSPIGSDNLSKVRASFIAVDGGSQSPPLFGLRHISGHSDSPPPPSRVKSFSSEDLDGGSQSSASSVQTTNGLGVTQKVNEPVEKKGSLGETVETQEKPKDSGVAANSADKGNQPTSKSSTSPATTASAAKPAKAVSKRPSNVLVGKENSQPSSRSPGLRPSTKPRSPISPTKSDSGIASRTTRTARPSINKTTNNDATKAPVHKPSRTSLASAARTSTRPVRSSTPATRETARTVPRASDSRSSSTTRPARLPASTTTPSLASAAKTRATGGTTSTLTRKPSSLRNTGTAAQRATTPTAASIRRQAPRPGTAQGESNRPSSRTSNKSTKPVDEGFLARMMRPTASSANKAHEKVEIKSPPRPTAARPSRGVPSKLETRPTRPTKEHSASGKPKARPAEHKAASRRTEKQTVETVQKGVADQPVLEPAVDFPSQSTEATVEEKSPKEMPPDTHAEPFSAPVPEPAGGKENEEVVNTHAAQLEEMGVETPASPKADEHVEQPTEAPVEPVTETPEGHVPAPSEMAVEQVIEPPKSDNNVETAEKTENAPVVLQEKEAEAPAEAASETGPKSNEVDIDIKKLSLNDEETY